MCRFDAIVEDLFEGFEADVETDTAAVFEAIDYGASRVGDVGGNVIERMGDHSFRKGFSHLASGDLDGGVVDSGGDRVLLEENPDSVRLLGSDVMKLERGEESDDRLGNTGGDFREAQVLIHFSLGMVVDASGKADEIAGLHGLGDYSAANPSFAEPLLTQKA